MPLRGRCLLPRSVSGYFGISAVESRRADWTSGRLWLWASLAIFLGIAFEMSFVRWRYLLRVRNALGISPDQRAGKGPPPASDEELAAALDSRTPVVNFVVGVGGIAVLVWLMMMKPF